MPRFFDFEIVLEGVTPRVWRRFLLEHKATFADLHDAIQIATGWQNTHLHAFTDHVTGKEVSGHILDEDEDEDDAVGSVDVALSTWFSADRRNIRYAYDFGDDWVHEIVFEERQAGDTSAKPVLLGGARACPPEDCGGPWGYNQALSGEVEWLDDDYNPETFEPKKVKFR